MNELHIYARRYVKLGWYIFPIKPGTKKEHYLTNGFNGSSNDPKQIDDWWTRWPDANIGLDCGRSGIVVVDVDTKDGKNGGESLVEIIQGDFEPLETPVAITWSNGRHYFYTGEFPRTIDAFKGRNLHDIDLCGGGGYVVLAPSVVTENGKTGTYRWAHEEQGEDRPPFLPFPPIFIPTEQERKRPPLREVDFLYERGRNDGLYRRGSAYRGLGSSQAAIEASLLIDNRERCRPPLEAAEVAKIAESAAKHEPNETKPLWASPQHLSIIASSHESYEPMTYDQLAEMVSARIDWIIEGLLRESGLLLMSAKPGAGKSDLARNLARAIATGGEWVGRTCTPGRVLWIGLEEPPMTLFTRLEVMNMNGLDITYRHSVPPGSQVAWLDTVIETEKPKIVIIDTLIHFFPEIKDVNSYSDVTKAAQALFALRTKHGTAFCLLHHNNHADSPLGSTQLSGMVDAVLSLTQNQDDTRTIRSTKIRDGIVMEPSVLAMDKDTGIITTTEPKWKADQRAAEQAILALMQPGVELGRQEIINQSKRRAEIGRRAIDALVSRGLLASHGTGTRSNPKLYSFIGDSGRELEMRQNAWDGWSDKSESSDNSESSESSDLPSSSDSSKYLGLGSDCLSQVVPSFPIPVPTPKIGRITRTSIGTPLCPMLGTGIPMGRESDSLIEIGEAENAFISSGRESEGQKSEESPSQFDESEKSDESDEDVKPEESEKSDDAVDAIDGKKDASKHIGIESYVPRLDETHKNASKHIGIESYVPRLDETHKNGTASSLPVTPIRKPKAKKPTPTESPLLDHALDVLGGYEEPDELPYPGES